VSVVPQHIAMLRYADEIRFARADVKRKLRAREMTVAEALPMECVAKMRLSDLLYEAFRLRGRSTQAKVDRLLGELQISPYRLVGKLTERQRLLIVAELGEGS
jgi:hypothetical protein